jgi:3-oxoacyl-[acyl-carrier protein] reductase
MTELTGILGNELDNQVAVVTGGSRGIGKAIVKRLAAAGAVVIFTYRTKKEAAEIVVAEVEGDGGHAWAIQADFALPKAADSLFEAIDRLLSRAGYTGIDILVNNAGVPSSVPFAEITEEEYDRVMTVNAKGVFFTTQQALSRLRDGGRIVSISSISTTWVMGGEAVYAASKGAVEQFSRVASRELGGRKITVNTIAPGVIDTELLRAKVPPELREGAVYMTPLGRLGQPEDVADALMLLVDRRARWITGERVRADGGLT